MDNGILPAGSIDFKQEMGLGNTGFGTLGSCVYIGQLIGSVACPYLLKKYKPKLVLLGCLGLNIASLIVFTLTENFLFLCACKLATGIF